MQYLIDNFENSFACLFERNMFVWLVVYLCVFFHMITLGQPSSCDSAIKLLLMRMSMELVLEKVIFVIIFSETSGN